MTIYGVNMDRSILIEKLLNDIVPVAIIVMMW